MFCGVYDGLGTMDPLAAYITKLKYTPEQSEALINYYLSVADYRYIIIIIIPFNVLCKSRTIVGRPGP